MVKWLVLKLFAMVVAVGLGMGGCAKPKSTVVVTVGGLGFSQLGDLRRAVEKNCPEVDVINAGGWDGYKADLTKYAKDRKRVVFVGHSFGCEAIADAAKQLKRVDLAVFIDPAWDDFKLPRNVNWHLWYKRSNFDLVREATIVGASRPVTIKGGHNEIPHSEELIKRVVAAINRITPAEGKGVGRVVAAK